MSIQIGHAGLRASHSASPLRGFELLPPAYRQQRRLQSVQYGWMTVILAMAVIFVAVTITTFVRRQQQFGRHQQLAAESMPLFRLRDDVRVLSAEHDQLQQWCDHVQSALPNDDLLQAMAAVAEATYPLQSTIRMESLHVRVPVEYSVDPAADGTVPSGPLSPPDWAKPTIKITARANPSSVSNWVQNINLNPRIDGASTDSDLRASSLPVQLGVESRQFRNTDPNQRPAGQSSRTADVVADTPVMVVVHATPIAERMLP
ncbi:hypothetical protein K227x_51010 [Rubripirellula lacrimiformis]|uniref:Fimbrial assembly protein (PilN) n=1 Tax=Rubripirellula lacrimiformis TaxID=1930273 RepID=A0A517NHT0_9BACT|nr:hypothetical protein [Rubripirellula lacrimiformis]QDT06685.1 hypothetical protein K227x_51010 [Rubripirellula lacrimiformis]